MKNVPKVNEVRARTILGDMVVVSVRLNDQSWEDKGYTLECGACSSCIGKIEAILLLQIVEENKGLRDWVMPPSDYVEGVCVLGKLPKVLSFKQKPAHCKYKVGQINDCEKSSR